MRTAPTFLAGALATLVVGVRAVVVRLVRVAAAVIDPAMRWRAAAWLRPAGARLSVSGLGHIGPEQPYVVVANHQSSLDPMVCVRALPLSLRFLAKRELFQIQVLNEAMRAVGMIPVDRRSPDLARIDAAAARSLGARHCLLVFPEGGVAGDGGVRRFKDGAFVIAIANQVPILPVAIYGTPAIWPPGHPAIRPGRVRVEVGTPVSTSGLTRADVDQLRDRVRGLIAATYDVLAAD